MKPYVFKCKIQMIKTHPIIRLPEEVSQALPSKGMVMGRIEILGFEVVLPLEPDGRGGHWLELSPEAMSHIDKSYESQPTGDILIQLSVENDWLRPDLPQDLHHALVHHHVTQSWQTLTPKAQWQWLRWIRFTQNPDTRSKRIMTTCSMLSSGKRRPCCFDQTRCTVTAVSKSGILLEPTD